jgi:hypothetical protein
MAQLAPVEDPNDEGTIDINEEEEVENVKVSVDQIGRAHV